MRRKLVSSETASRPVFPGSKGMFSRTISATFLALLRGLSEPPFHKSSGNPSAILLDAPTSDAIRFVNLVTFRFGRPDLDLANYCSFWHLQQHSHYPGHVLGMNFPVFTHVSARRAPAKFGGDAARHDGAYADIVVTCIHKQRLTETVQTELRSV